MGKEASSKVNTAVNSQSLPLCSAAHKGQYGNNAHEVANAQKPRLVHFVGDPAEKEMRREIEKRKSPEQKSGALLAQAFPYHNRHEMDGNGAIGGDSQHHRGHQ